MRTAEEKFKYLYTMDEISSDRLLQLSIWMGLTQKAVLDVALRDLFLREAAERELPTQEPVNRWHNPDSDDMSDLSAEKISQD